MRTLRERVTRVDVALALAVAAALELDAWAEDLTPHAVATTAFALLGALLVLRRAAPLPVLLVGVTTLLVAVAAGMSMAKPVTPLLFYVLVLYAVGLYEELTRSVSGLVVALALTFTTIVLDRRNGNAFNWTDFVFAGLILTAPWFVGRAMRGRVSESKELKRRAERLEHERLEVVAQERARIARELHDVVAHSVTVMVVQAGAAEEVLKREPERALAPLRSVQETGRQALIEMSRLVGLLREESHELGLAPQPGLDQLDELLAQVREAGLPVEFHVEGERRSVPIGIDLSAYRILQEALTNALKHAGKAHAEVHLRYRSDALELDVLDDGPGSGNGFVSGHGLVGMRERVSVFGGELAAGPRPEGGFAVHVRLPLEAGA